MSRQTLQALSAAPRSRLISADSWQVQRPQKKQQRPPDSYNYQHWLIQVSLWYIGSKLIILSIVSLQCHSV